MTTISAASFRFIKLTGVSDASGGTIDPGQGSIWYASDLLSDLTWTLPPASQWEGLVLILLRAADEGSAWGVTVTGLAGGDVSLPGPGDGIWVHAQDGVWTVVNAFT